MLIDQRIKSPASKGINLSSNIDVKGSSNSLF
jgi:hypothetical protein